MGLDIAFDWSAADVRDPVQERVPEWWEHADAFPRWYVWRGVTGLYYARVPGITPQRVVHARTPEGLLLAIIDDNLSWEATAFTPRQRTDCA
ncbi:MAG TPA: hypothetical protein VGG75_34315 [Trebonia sp.]|jgi:hypothetical protein